MGLSSKKSSQQTTQNQTTHLTTTPTNPEWVDKGLAGVGQTLTNLAGQDPYSFIAGPDALQTQAANGAAGLGLSGNYDKASSMLSGLPQISAASLLDGPGVSAYMSPYLRDVVDATANDLNVSDDRARAQQMLDLGNDTTFGGSSGSLLRSMTEGELSRARAQSLGGLRNQGYGLAAQLADSDAARRQAASIANGQQAIQAAQGLASIGQAQGQDSRANLGLQADIGAQLQALAQQKAGAPLALAQGLTSMWSQLPLNLLHGQTADGTMSGTSSSTGKESGSGLGDWLNFFAANAAAAAKAAGGGA